VVLGTGAVVAAYQVSKRPVDQKSEPARKTVIPDGYDGPVAQWPIFVDKTPKTLAILKKLDEPIAMKFSTETPLEDVKKYIQDSTQDEAAGLPTGIPIYIDPQGLQDADITMLSTISIDLEGIPLKTTLRLLLKQIGLTYEVKDGLLTITANNPNDHPSLDMDRRGELTREQHQQLMEVLKLRIELIKLQKELNKLEYGKQ
jgi:hypothetical protein